MKNFWGEPTVGLTLPVTDETGLLFWAGVIALVIAVAIWLWPRR